MLLGIGCKISKGYLKPVVVVNYGSQDGRKLMLTTSFCKSYKSYGQCGTLSFYWLFVSLVLYGNQCYVCCTTIQSLTFTQTMIHNWLDFIKFHFNLSHFVQLRHNSLDLWLVISPPCMMPGLIIELEELIIDFQLHNYWRIIEDMKLIRFSGWVC